MAGFTQGVQQKNTKINGEERPSLEDVTYTSGLTDPLQITNEVLSTIPEDSNLLVFTVTKP
eukprot:13818803-Ditylum_brightwellii.AAC.1